MTTTTLSRDEVTSALAEFGIESASQVSFKAAAGAPVAERIDVDEDTGVVTAIVSVTGVVDSVDDIIMPGAYTKTLGERNPKVCWHHSWERPIGRVEEITEWRPGDSRLPSKTKDGKPWPKDAGALVAKMRFNMKSERGREAFEAVKFYSESGECEWSIGYRVPPGESRKDAKGQRLIKSLDLFEVSFVLFGAAPLSMTLDVKSADLLAEAQAWERRGDAREAVVDVDADAEEKALHEAAAADVDTERDRLAPVGFGVVDATAIKAAVEWRPEVRRVVRHKDMLAEAKAGRALPDGSYPIVDEHDLRAALDHVAAKGVDDETVRDHVATAAIRLGREDLLAEGYPDVKDDRADKPTLPGEGNRFPIANREDLRKAVQAYGRAADEDKPRVKRWIMRRARELGAENLLPESWTSSKDAWAGVDDAPDPGEVKAEGGADRNRGGAEKLRRWYVHGEGAARIRWGEPGDFMRCVRIAGKHMSRAKGYCANRHKDALGVWPGQEDGKKSAQAMPVTSTGGADEKRAETMTGTGAMVALPIPDAIAKKVAVADGTDPEHLHVTLAFLGDAADLDDTTRAAVKDAAAAVAADTEALTGTIGGLGQFPDGGDGVPTWVPVDVPGLSQMREALVKRLVDAGVDVNTQHGYTPHVTLGYDVKDAAPVESTPVEFDRVTVVLGEEVVVEEFTGAPGYDPSRDAPEAKDATVPADMPEDTLEDRIDAVRAAACEAFGDLSESDDEPSRTFVFTTATWPDRALVRVIHRSNGDADADVDTYEVPYVMRDGHAVLGDPRRVKITAVIEDDTETDVDVDDDAARWVEASLCDAAAVLDTARGGVEGKSGRVLSGANTGRLRSAMENLLAVLAAAGVEILPPSESDVRDERQAVDDTASGAGYAPTPDSTSVPATRATARTKDDGDGVSVKDLLSEIGDL